MGKLVEEGMKAGWLLATEGCLPTALGARVRNSSGKLTVTDGPFTEAKEVVGGFAILRANSKEEAIQLAREFLQVAGEGECELRQIFEADKNLDSGLSVSPDGRWILYSQVGDVNSDIMLVDHFR